MLRLPRMLKLDLCRLCIDSWARIPQPDYLIRGWREHIGKQRKIRVPDMFQLDAISDVRAFCASRKINKFRVFNGTS